MARCASLVLGIFLTAGTAAAGIEELERLRSSVEAGEFWPEGVGPRSVLEGLSADQRREALYLLSFAPAERADLDSLLRELSLGSDELSQLAAAERIELALLAGEPEAVGELSEEYLRRFGNSPHVPAVLLQSARASFLAGKVSPASEGFLQIILRFPSSPEAGLAQLGLGDCYLADGLLPEALAQYELVLLNRELDQDCLARLRLTRAAMTVENDIVARQFMQELGESCPNTALKLHAEQQWPELLSAPAPEPASAAAEPVEAAKSGEADSQAALPESGSALESVSRPQPAESSDEVARRRAEGYWVQIGAYTQEENALRLSERLVDVGAGVKIVEIQTSGRVIYKVWLGPLESQSQAAELVQRLETDQSLFGFVVR